MTIFTDVILGVRKQTAQFAGWCNVCQKEPAEDQPMVVLNIRRLHLTFCQPCKAKVIDYLESIK